MIKTDTIRTIYKELFIVRLIHPAFDTTGGSEIFNSLAVVPDTATAYLFNRFLIDYRCINDSIICFIRSELLAPPAKEPKIPFTAINENIRIRFLIKALPRFIYSTYVTAAGSSSVYYFNNSINNEQSGKNFISKVVENYNAGNSYDEGTIVTHAGEPYTTLKPVAAADAISIANTAFWKKVLPAGQVVNNADLQAVSSVKPSETCFAVIDVFNTGTTNINYNLFGGSNELLSPVYHITFKSKT